jgi:hypothetical protein
MWCFGDLLGFRGWRERATDQLAMGMHWEMALVGSLKIREHLDKLNTLLELNRLKELRTWTISRVEPKGPVYSINDLLSILIHTRDAGEYTWRHGESSYRN